MRRTETVGGGVGLGRRVRGLIAAAGAVGPLVVYGAVLIGLPGCLAFPPRQGSMKADARVSAFPSAGLDLSGPARVFWNANQIPFVETAEDRDLPYVMGLVMAHQRLGQMEVLRRASQGRLAEMAGPLAGFVDATLRALDFGKSSAATLEMMRPDTRAWVERFVAGINAYRARVKDRPAEFSALGLGEEEWTAADILTIGRLAGTDINWGLWYAVLRLRDDPKWPEVYERIKGYGLLATPSFGPMSPLDLAAGLSKSGSNTFVVSGARTASGSAIIANDPHVGLNLPNLWMVMGIKSPSVHAVGMMLPGLPAVLLGRNESIAFGGTNMRSLSTATYDVSKLAASEITTREAVIRQRWWLPRRETIRETRFGPILTDTPLFSEARKRGAVVAFKWRGHEPSDELSAFLDMNRARSFEEFRAAFGPYAVSGQNFLYADPKGNIGQVLALEYDGASGRTALAGVGDPANPEHAWGVLRVKSTELPFAYNPEAGYLVSANNNPVRTDPPVTIAANGDSRMARISELIASEKTVSLEKARAIQMDVYSLESHEVARAIVARASAARQAGTLSSGALRALAAIEAWDGRYDVDSLGVPVLQSAMKRLGERAYTKRYGERLSSYLMGAEAIYRLMREDLDAGLMDAELPGALEAAASDTPEGLRWGDRHKLRVAHYLGAVPVLGGGWRYAEFGVAGSLKTVFKTANNVTNDTHRATYGTSARHISDLRDLDENYFVLLGGQDGWIGSASMLDQVELWRTGGSIRVPMRMESVRTWATSVTELTGAGGGGR